jgi:hypothetical protein
MVTNRKFIGADIQQREVTTIHCPDLSKLGELNLPRKPNLHWLGFCIFHGNIDSGTRRGETRAMLTAQINSHTKKFADDFLDNPRQCLNLN